MFDYTKNINDRISGFTLIELLVVISIIGFLATASLVAFNSARIKARDAKRIADINQIQTALNLFFDSYSMYPQVSGAGTWQDVWGRLQNCLQTGINCGFTPSGYVSAMSNVPQDPSGGTATYYYYHCSSGASYRLLSILESGNNPALSSSIDFDGNFYSTDGRCNDANKGFCIGTEQWCW